MKTGEDVQSVLGSGAVSSRAVHMGSKDQVLVRYGVSESDNGYYLHPMCTPALQVTRWEPCCTFGSTGVRPMSPYTLDTADDLCTGAKQLAQNGQMEKATLHVHTTPTSIPPPGVWEAYKVETGIKNRETKHKRDVGEGTVRCDAGRGWWTVVDCGGGREEGC
ncbi:hypothetical protein FB45DRAFT_879171 [Roridomyces roridus]|uniref:Uncharacterized protein n=1 Tax=Roridomyces roridus TaxID=1738132 RepID=A0AAD7AZP4_9AGAR|nr:hypothetical protein FB45DRAFT_879171 [Roridomyces roridus]